MKYDIIEHRHRFSAWAAARAVQRGFQGANSLKLMCALKECGIVDFLRTADLFSFDLDTFEDLHRKWCRSVQEILIKDGIQISFGRSAKLIAVYIKTVVVLSGNEKSDFSGFAHPPIDKKLLRELVKTPKITSKHKKIWSLISWTKLDENDYYELIKQIRESFPVEKPFWMIEEFWQP